MEEHTFILSALCLLHCIYLVCQICKENTSTVKMQGYVCCFILSKLNELLSDKEERQAYLTLNTFLIL